MPSPTDFNLSPYYDDFTESKKFHRILFRPSFAVQARELTQSQTILQNQIERVGDHLFKQVQWLFQDRYLLTLVTMQLNYQV